MLTTQVAEIRTSLPSVSALHPVQQAGRQRQGALWSSLKDICALLQMNLSGASGSVHDEAMFQHIQYKTGQRVHMIGQPFDNVYIVNSGFLKTVLIDDFANEQVLSFPMRGDLLGVDGIHSKKYESEVIALSDCDLIAIPFKKLTELGRSVPELECALYGVMSRELVKEQVTVGMLGSLSADARVARFLVNISERFAQMGYSSKLFNLRMTRQEIGSYLGLTLETVSRTLSAFNEVGYITVDQRTIGIKDPDALKTLRRLSPSRARGKQNAAAKAPIMAAIASPAVA